MAAMEAFEDFIRAKIELESWTHKQVSVFLQENHPGRRGFSVRSVERFCSCKGIHRTPRVNNEALDQTVSKATDMVSVAPISI